MRGRHRKGTERSRIWVGYAIDVQDMVGRYESISGMEWIRHQDLDRLQGTQFMVEENKGNRIYQVEDFR